MYNKKKLVVTFFLALLQVSCIGPTNPKHTVIYSTPDWYSTTTTNSSVYYYGTGEGDTKEEAQNSALSQIASQISVTIKSTFNSQQNLSIAHGNETYSSEIKKKVESTVKAIRFSNFETTEIDLINGRYYLLVRVDRDALYNSKLKKLKLLDNEIKTMWKRYQMLSFFEKLTLAKKLNQKIEDVRVMFPILSAINSKFNETPYSKNYTRYQEAIKNIKNEVIVCLKETNAKEVVRVIETHLAQFNIINIIDCKKEISKEQSDNLIIINIKRDAVEYKFKSASSKMANVKAAKITLTLTTVSHNNEIIAKNILYLKNFSKKSYQDAVEKTNQLDKIIQKNGILKILTGDNKPRGIGDAE